MNRSEKELKKIVKKMWIPPEEVNNHTHYESSPYIMHHDATTMTNEQSKDMNRNG